ncbi:nucleotidyltransferase substrate-binding protein HI0074 family [Candidatus Termititenax aidoneus]|uniref:Nucleotidyltransferase substrate-binding protein HI0074 family n=1 Tax=Termititenax aidoneus TaxID=2218524 RepID=A0A388T9J6_TERA1|nr:nucleotidyltransferase substrate-binding protein HI0074 family [Candidatus Termititenax aidoneus]
MSDQDIRWKQRFQNYNEAIRLLRSAIEGRAIDSLNDLEQEGAIQRFEYTYELALNTLRDYMQENGVVLKESNPRAVIKEAFALGIIEDGQIFINMMLARNAMAHCYDHAKFVEILGKIQADFLPALVKLHAFWAVK